MRDRNSRSLLLAVLSALFLFHPSIKAAETEFMFVQVSTGELRQEAKMAAPKVADLKRGERVAVVESTEKWVRVKKGKSEGWVPRMFLSANKPVGQADLAKDLPVSLEKASRKRANSYTSSAASRGLLEGDVPGKKKGDKTDYKSVEKIEKVKASKAELDNFASSAKLKTDSAKTE